MVENIKQINVTDKSGTTKTYNLQAVLADKATSIDSQTGLWVNTSGNLEINSGLAGAEKLNLVSAGAIQVKPADGEPLQLDCEQNTADLYEYGIKVCNGALPKTARVVATKLNTTEVTLDTQKAYASADKEEFDIKARYDKWNGGEVLADGSGPIRLRIKARSLDLRCHDHGGIALQIAGQDSSLHENKIKFESDRTSGIGEAPTYCKEGGKGVEFGTFNTEHTSLYTGDYRFKGDAKVYGVTRNAPVETSTGKIDYPTQSDDFKDVIDYTKHATWNEIIAVASAYAAAGNKFVSQEVTDESGNTIDISQFITSEALADYATKSELDAKTFELPTVLCGITTSNKGHMVVSSSIMDKPAIMEEEVEVSAATVANLNLESNGNIKIETKNGGLNITSSNITADSSKREMSLDGEKISLSNVSGNGLTTVEAINGISLGITSSIVSVGSKISTKGKLESSDLTISLAYLNNSPSTAYLSSVDGKVHIPYDLKDFYVAGSTEETPSYYDPATMTAKTIAYADVLATENFDVTPSYYYIRSKSDDNVWVVECELDKNGNSTFKKVNVDKPTNHGIVSELEGFENTVIEDLSYAPEATDKTLAANSVEPYLTVKLSDLLGLISRVEALEEKVQTLESYHPQGEGE